MKCANCNRPLSAAAVRVVMLDLGPVCAKRLGLAPVKAKKGFRLAHRVVSLGDAQLELELDV